MDDAVATYLGDCLEVMDAIPSRSVDLILCDLPYGTTACPWDAVIPFNLLWAHYDRVLKPAGAAVFTACQPFTAHLLLSNLPWFRQELIWEKTMPTGFLDANRKPMKAHENILVFARVRHTYNPQMTTGAAYTMVRGPRNGGGTALTADPQIRFSPWTTVNAGTRYPKTVLRFAHDKLKIHPTQKPVALLEYLVRTYSNEGELVLDNCMGSGSAGVACVNAGRRFVGIERDAGYYEAALGRIADAQFRLDRPHAPPARLLAPGKGGTAPKGPWSLFDGFGAAS